MNHQEKKISPNLRPLGLTAALCFLSIAAAIDMEYGTALIGYALLAVMLGVLCVIFMTCERYIFVLDAVSAIVILFFAGSGSLMSALLGVVAITGAMILAVFVRKRCNKTVAVICTCITFAVGSAAVFAILYAAEGGSLMPNDLFALLNEAFDDIKVLGASVMRDYLNAMPEEYFRYYEQEYEITKDALILVNIEAVETYVDYIQMLLPGFFVFIMQVWGWIASVSFEKTVKFSRYDALLPETRWQIRPTQVSCIAYIVVASVYIITQFFSTTSVFALIVTNFWIALLPAMLACGLRSLRLRLSHPHFRMPTVIVLIVFGAGIFFMPSTALMLGIFMLAFTGAQDVSLTHAAESAKKDFNEKK